MNYGFVQGTSNVNDIYVNGTTSFPEGEAIVAGMPNRATALGAAAAFAPECTGLAMMKDD